jgi:regulator of sigma E protease
MTVILFFVVLFVLILVHEWGHFIVAKKTGMRVDEFGIGFPPKLFSIKKGETEYSFNALPIGGFVRIFGEDGTNVPSSPSGSEAVGGRYEALAETGRGGEDGTTVLSSGQKADDTSRAFSRRPKWAQTAVLLAGVTMNILFAWFLFVVVFLIGVPTAVEEGKQSDDARLVVTEVLHDSPAANAGIPVGAEVVRYSDQAGRDLSPTDFRAYTSSAEGIVLITYKAGGEEKTIEVVPQTGLIAGNESQKAVGIALTFVETVRKPIHIAIYDATTTTIDSLVAITIGIAGLLGDIVQLDADLSQVAGPVGIVGLVGDAAQFGFTSLLMFTAVISLNLAVINVLPFPALDGGRLILVFVEGILRKPINPVWVARLNTLGFILLMALMFAVTYSDIAKLV